MEELGIDFSHVLGKAKKILQPWAKTRTHVYREDEDLTGPLVAACALGGALMLRGRLHFSHIYAVGIFGCISTFLLLNLMTSSRRKVDLAFVVSTLGYALFPTVVLAVLSLINVAVSIPLWISAPVVVAFIGWATWSATEVRPLTLSSLTAQPSVHPQPSVYLSAFT